MKPYLLLLLLTCSFNLTAQTNLDDFTYTSEQEKTYLQQIDSVDIFHLFYSVEYQEYDNSVAILNSFHTFLNELKRSQKVTTPKGMLKSFRAIHGMYFTKYLKNPRFYEIFREGIYNCVTATALYAMAFDYLGIPYQIMKTPVHVYLVAESKYGEIIIESTIPEGGFFMLSDKSVKELKRYLLSSKIITYTEASNLSDKNLVHDFYLSDTKISLKELLAILYYNRAIYEGVENQDAQKTLMHLEKANYIAEMKISEELINLAYIDLVNDEALSIANFIKYNKQYYFFETRTEGNDYIEYRIDHKVNKLIELKKTTQLDSLNTALNSIETEDDFFRRILNRNYHILATYYTNSLEDEKALKELEKIDYNLYPEGKLMAFAGVANKLSVIGTLANGLDTIAKYETAFPFLKTDNKMQGMKAACYLGQMGDSFTIRNDIEGTKYYNTFIEKFKPDTKAVINEELLTYAFATASKHYVHIGNYTKAKEILREGLKYSPSNVELNRKLEVLVEPKNHLDDVVPTELSDKMKELIEKHQKSLSEPK